jgi:hypothetical protein
VSDPLWDAEAERYLALTREARLKWMSQLLFALTMFARDTYTVGTDGLDDPERMRRFNEMTHRATDQLRNQLDNTVGRPEEIFMKMIGEGIQELGIGVPSILSMLQR